MTHPDDGAAGALRPHHFGISVPDLEAAVQWYRRMLGFTLEERNFLAKIPAHVAFIRRGDFRIEIFQVENAAPLPADRRVPNLDLKTHGNKHMCFEVPDVRAATARLREAGADIAFEVVVDGSAVLFVRDCAGNLVELVEPFDSRPPKG